MKQAGYMYVLFIYFFFTKGTNLCGYSQPFLSYITGHKLSNWCQNHSSFLWSIITDWNIKTCEPEGSTLLSSKASFFLLWRICKVKTSKKQRNKKTTKQQLLYLRYVYKQNQRDWLVIFQEKLVQVDSVD